MAFHGLYRHLVVVVVRGRHFSTRPGTALPHVGTLNILLAFRIFEQLWACPEKQSLPWNVSLYWNILYHSGFLSNLRLLWKTEFALKYPTVLNIFLTIQDFWATLRLYWKAEFALKIFNTGGFRPPRLVRLWIYLWISRSSLPYNQKL